jgi:hypothetical protein
MYAESFVKVAVVGAIRETIDASGVIANADETSLKTDTCE